MAMKMKFSVPSQFMQVKAWYNKYLGTIADLLQYKLYLTVMDTKRIYLAVPSQSIYIK